MESWKRERELEKRTKSLLGKSNVKELLIADELIRLQVVR